MAMRELELYIHIPFCVRKCMYCDFLSGPADEKDRDLYVNRLCEEITSRGKVMLEEHNHLEAQAAMQELSVVSIFFGGGTPSLLSGEQLAAIMRAIRAAFPVAEEAEITMECNPGTVTVEKLQKYYKAGINRLSIGLQSAQDNELKLLGRIHSWQDFLDTYRAARECGFKNINVDLMSALPGQTMDTLQDSLKQMVSLCPPPEHISAYSLILEDGTPLKTLVESGNLTLPDEDEERRMYWQVIRYLTEHGYQHYEISNLARPGYACRHNEGYWTGREYLGFGIGAASYCKLQNEYVRFSNTRELAEYLMGENEYSEYEVLSEKDRMEEFMFLGLRRTEGISDAVFEKLFDKSLQSVYGNVIEKNVKEGLLSCDMKGLRLTDKGLDLANYVFAQFLIDD